MTANKGKVLLQVQGLEKKFDDNQVLDGITTDICQGEVVAVIGPSGSGKTTLIRLLNGLEQIDNGEIQINGQPFIHLDRQGQQKPRFMENAEHRLNIGMVFQSFNLFPHLTVFGNLLLAGGYLHHKRNFDPVLAFFSRLLQTRGVVRPIVRESLHLAAELDDGSVLVGQHLFRALPRPVRRLFLTVHEPERLNEQDCLELPATPCRPPLAPAAGVYLSSAGAICYPMGSFYTSVLANLLPQGGGKHRCRSGLPQNIYSQFRQRRRTAGAERGGAGGHDTAPFAGGRAGSAKRTPAASCAHRFPPRAL